MCDIYIAHCQIYMNCEIVGDRNVIRVSLLQPKVSILVQLRTVQDIFTALPVTVHSYRTLNDIKIVLYFRKFSACKKVSYFFTFIA